MCVKRATTIQGIQEVILTVVQTATVTDMVTVMDMEDVDTEDIMVTVGMADIVGATAEVLA